MNTPTIKAVVRPSKLNKNGQVPIQIVVSFASVRSEISSGKYIFPDQWDKENQVVKGRCDESRTINLHIAKMIRKLEEICFEADLNNRKLTPADLTGAYQGNLDSVNGRTLVSILNEYVDNCEKQRREPDEAHLDGYAPGTLAHFHVTLRKVKAFLLHKFKKEDIYVKDIGQHFLADFDLYLRTSYTTKNHNNTAVKTIKRFLGMTERYHHEFGVANFRKTYDKKFRHQRKDHLSWEELERIDQAVFTHERLDRARDVFIFACYTALGYAELAALSAKHIQRSEGGKMFISRMVRRKTGEEVTTPLLIRAQKILTKYKEHPEVVVRKKLLPVLSNQKYNLALKEIAQYCDIDKELTSHCARRNFAVTVAGENGLTLEVIARWLSHASTKTTQQYYFQVSEKMLEKASDMLEAQISKRYFVPETFNITGEI